jgi:hypothetical protein
MNAFLIVVIVVAVVGIGLALTWRFRPTRAMEQIGRRGGAWSAPEDEDPEARARPFADEREEPVPFRPLRGRPD